MVTNTTGHTTLIAAHCCSSPLTAVKAAVDIAATFLTRAENVLWTNFLTSVLFANLSDFLLISDIMIRL